MHDRETAHSIGRGDTPVEHSVERGHSFCSGQATRQVVGGALRSGDREPHVRVKLVAIQAAPDHAKSGHTDPDIVRCCHFDRIFCAGSRSLDAEYRRRASAADRNATAYRDHGRLAAESMGHGNVSRHVGVRIEPPPGRPTKLTSGHQAGRDCE
jgi:hypothetical protein